MGWSSRDVRAASLWEFQQAAQGWVEQNCVPDEAAAGGGPKPPSVADHLAAMARFKPVTLADVAAQHPASEA